MLIRLSILFHLLLVSVDSEVDIPINYRILKSGKAEKCMHEEFRNNRVCTQEAAKIIKTTCTEVYYIEDADGVKTTSKQCGRGTKYDCDQFDTICEETKVPADKRIPCCVCINAGSEIKNWECGKTSHSGVITKDVIDFCHPALEYRGDKFMQAMDDDVLPGAGFCDNNFAAGDSVLYQFYCDEATGSLQCGGGNREHGRNFVLDSYGTRRNVSTLLTIILIVIVSTFLV
jgi:hypothetical protein